MTQPASFPFTIKMGTAKTAREFPDLAALEAWRTSEEPLWRWTHSLGEDQFRRGEFGARVTSELDQIRVEWRNLIQHLNQYRANPNENATLVNNIHSGLVHFYRDARPLSSDPEGAFLLSLSTASINTIAAAYLALRDSKLESTMAAVRGYLLGMTYKQGQGETAERAKDHLDRVRVDISDWFSQKQSSISEFLAQAQSTRGELQRLENEFRVEVSAQRGKTLSELDVLRVGYSDGLAAMLRDTKTELVKIGEQFEAERAATTASLDAFKSATEAAMALQAPVSYWTEKRDLHKDRAWWWALFFILSTVVASIGLVVTACLLLPEEADWAKVPVSRLAVAAVVVTAVLWLVRATARLFLSHQHLATDADERVAMVKTYLALLKSGSAINDGDRSLMLNAMFRRTSTGIVKEDANPPVLFAEALRAKSS